MDNLNQSFAVNIFKLLAKRVPSDQEAEFFELILNLCIDHGPESPSAVKTIEAAKEGKSMGEAVGAGIAEIGDRHGGAMKPGMEFMLQIKDGADTKQLVQQYLDEKKAIGGYGHRIYKDQDPRAELLIKKLEDAGLGSEYITIARQIEKTLEELKGTKLVLNIDGAIAVVLLTFNWSSSSGPAVFISSRAPGLCNHYLTASNQQS